ncbi:NAD(P)/FAD-dependent oxidoreductase [Streptomyces sp. NPDC094143]|uniref:NAD(P)/FAD-dependent oxidoreductase n=1 Tax=Streptomyces sp. NPDC094143 TaxID=3155310 RepID=UPI0033253E85
MTDEYDIAIVGGGPAGLSAALVLARAGRRVAVVDAGAPRNAPASHVHGYLTQDGTPPKELLAAGRAEVTAYGARLIDGTVVGAEPGFRVHLADGGQLTARRILVTTGLRDELPDVEGVAGRFGRDVLHCPYCHGYEVRDRPLGVLGGTPGTVRHALLVRQWSRDVTYFAHTGQLTPDEREQLTARGVRVVEGTVARLATDGDGTRPHIDRLHGVELADGTVVPCAAVFVLPRFLPNSGLLTDLGCATDEDGWVIADRAGRTSVPGVLAAGNAVDPRAQVVTAAGAGSAAAIALNADLVEEDVRRAIADRRACSDAFSPAMERRVAEAVLDDRRHGLEDSGTRRS